MTDDPRFIAFHGLPENAHQHYHGAPLVELVFRIADAWQNRPRGGQRSARLSAVAEAFHTHNSGAGPRDHMLQGSDRADRARRRCAEIVTRLNACVAAGIKAQTRLRRRHHRRTGVAART